MLQFWYTEETARAVAEEVVDLAAGGGIACLACPSLFRCLRADFPDAAAHLLEYDRRFEVQLPMQCFLLNKSSAPSDSQHVSHHAGMRKRISRLEDTLGLAGHEFGQQSCLTTAPAQRSTESLDEVRKI